ncbi:rhamnose ABC transporter, rhamnose-binding protein [Acididesulfobacillus acetoxydans]|uniref:Rhamnose ABC transporter, rhamnose-binding protein n=1 Tax=Acididesulfobacillus acetoxydans TaxID=1561005 RepID=A0A8S0Y2X0_9FIRM|nr:rhamnose ABC transporter substrate-binding protein [Acididesulfobacillus acetoxydans]CAA7601315.1 rhamnose ABC transporter, rhamnose-binding protein [Acididesulfobacillus acetoxydans]CEJ08775.1 Rhamnose ABC transporter, rhamnose-binding protein [Acididesulfobacillus acetoxydans]
MKRKGVLALMLTSAMLMLSVAGCSGNKPVATENGTSSGKGTSASSNQVYAIIAKNTGNPYNQAETQGFQDAVKEFGGKSIVRAPEQPTAEGQITIINQLIAQKVASIAIASNDANALEPVLQKAMSAGIKVLSCDSAVNPASRMVHVDQADPVKIGQVEVQAMGKMMNYTGEFAILSATSTADNQNTWIKYMKEELKKPEYKKMRLVKIAYGDDLPDKSTSETEALLQSYPKLKGIISPTTVGIAAAAKVLSDKGLAGKVYLTGLGLPSQMITYIKSGVCPWMYLWNPIDIGYITGYVSKALVDGTITGKIGDTFTAGRLGKYTVTKAADGGTEVLLGPPYKFDKANIDRWAKVY